MKQLEATAALSVLQAVQSMGDEPTVIIKDGRPVAVLLPTEGADLETISLSLNAQFNEIMERSAARLYAEGGLTEAEVRRRLAAYDAANAKTNGRRDAKPDSSAGPTRPRKKPPATRK